MWGIEAQHVFQAVTAGLVVLLGVLVTHWLQARRARRERTDDSLLQVTHLLPGLAPGYIFETIRTDDESKWHSERAEVSRLLSYARTQARGFRGAKDRRTAIDDVTATIAAASAYRKLNGPLPPQAMLDLFGTELRQAMGQPSSRPMTEIDDQLAKWGLGPLIDNHGDDSST